MEILAPLPSLSSVEELFSRGADYLYTGITGHSREGVPGTPGEVELARWGREHPQFAGRIHIALNRVPHPGEYPSFISIVESLMEAGYHHFIVNDHGLLRSLAVSFPLAELCASVGLTTVNPFDSLFLEELGAGRVVLPTFSTPDDVRDIKKYSSLKVEVFAVCRGEPVAQGKCMLSGYLVTGNKGSNRTTGSAKRGGKCHTVCRGILGTQPIHDITPHLSPWVEAGTDTFKIEGRYRSLDEIVRMVERLRMGLQIHRKC